jgi:hypothetical protein
MSAGAVATPHRRRKLSGKNVHGENLCFVIGRPRSGTTVFKAMLQTHPEIWSLREVLNENNPRSYFNFLKRLQSDNRDALLPSRSVDNFVKYLGWCRRTALEKQPQNKVVILDVKYDQAHLLCEPWWSITALPRIFSLMRELGCKVIDVHRNDVVRLVISNQIAIKTQIYHSNKLEPGEGQDAKIRIDTDRLLREVNATLQAYEKVVRHFRGYPDYLQITYETMFDGETFSDGLISRVASFLGVSDQFERIPQLSKLLVEDIFSYIENADEVRARLARQSPPERPALPADASSPI